MQRRRGQIIDTAEAARALFARAMEGARDERLQIAHLDARSRLVGLRLRFGADARRVPLAIRAIVADALRLGSAVLILAHNHPSGDPEPTAADLDATRVLLQALRPLGIGLRDHLVFAAGGVVSFRARGLL